MWQSSYDTEKWCDISFDQKVESLLSIQTLETTVQVTTLNSNVKSIQQWVSCLLGGADPFIKMYSYLIFFGFCSSSQMERKCCTSFIVNLYKYSE